MNIGIVTSFYNGYGKYLPGWLESISKLTTKPSEITIVISGDNHGLTNNLYTKCIELIKRINVSTSFHRIYEHKGMGYARNEAVRKTNTEWIMYLDVDDRILPHAVNEIFIYENEADVICTGFQMIQNDKIVKTKIFKNVSAKRVLQGFHCSCSHSPYRKIFWEQAPYIETNDLIEQSFWIGFAHLGARFAATKKPCTNYCRHDDSFMGKVTKEELNVAKLQRQRIAREGVKHIKSLLLESDK
jgi:glycosyltransferase involved in cell wall biosynthesis